MSQRIIEGDVDKLILSELLPLLGSKGVMVDVGAASPDYLSVSAIFRELGWRVIAIEPNPHFCAIYRERGYEIYQYAAGDHDENKVDFQIVDSHGADYLSGKVSYESFSSLKIKPEFANLKSNLDTKTVTVDMRKLDTILQEAAIDKIDILSVDVEGWELEVLGGLTLKPTVMVVENLFNDDAYRRAIARRGYTLWRYVPPNDVYINSGLRWRLRLRSLRSGIVQFIVGTRKRTCAPEH